MILKLIGQSNSFRFTSLIVVTLICVTTLPALVSGDQPPTESTTVKKRSQGKDASNGTPIRNGLKRLRNRIKVVRPNKEKTGLDSNSKRWKPLKDSWVVSQFGGDGPVEIKDKLITMGLGDPLTGIRWEDELPKENYEVELEARRREGFDFFCALTFPVGKKHVSFILGGWGGGVVGISSVDGFDASENQTTSFRNFDTDRWYKVRARVDANQIQCWIDDKPAAEQLRKGHEFDIRYEMDQCVPLGVAAFQCKTEYRNLRIRKLSAQEIKAGQNEAAKPEGSDNE